MVSLPDEVKDRVLSYIKHQAAKGTPELKQLIQKGHEQILAQLAGMSDEQAGFKPGPGDWSVFEVLRHAVDAERRNARGCVALAEGKSFDSIDQIAVESEAPFTTMSAARTALESSQQEMLAFVDALSPESSIESNLLHPFFGPLNCREWAAFQRVHDGDHAGQIEQIVAAAGYPA